MPDLVLDLLKYAFLAVLYIFIGRAVRAVYVELKPVGSPSSAPTRSAPRRAKKVPRKAIIVQGDGRGKTFDLGDELIIGRADKCHVIVNDSYASQIHARVFAKGDTFVVEDLGSTNGTYLNRKRITAPVELQRGDQIKIGKTVLEMRK